MANLTAWDVAIFVVAVYIAVVSLVRLMRARRDAIVGQLHAEVTEQQERQRADKRREPQQARRAAPAARATHGSKG